MFIEQQLLSELEITEKKIKKALEENNFVQVSRLAITFDEQIKRFTEHIDAKSSVTEKDKVVLKALSSRLKVIENETEKQFRNFSSNTSTKTKMHNAYKEYGS